MNQHHDETNQHWNEKDQETDERYPKGYMIPIRHCAKVIQKISQGNSEVLLVFFWFRYIIFWPFSLRTGSNAISDECEVRHDNEEHENDYEQNQCNYDTQVHCNFILDDQVLKIQTDLLNLD